VTAVIGIQCDGCGKTLARTTRVQVSTTAVRADLREAGWHKTRGVATYRVATYPDGGEPVMVDAHYGYARDICPECWATGAR